MRRESLFHLRSGLGRDTGKKSPSGGDGKQFFEPAFALSLATGSLSLIRSSVQLPLPDVVALFQSPAPPPAIPFPPENRVLTKEALRDGPGRTGAKGWGGRVTPPLLPPTGYFSPWDLREKTRLPLEDPKAVFVYIKALSEQTAP